MRKEEAEQELKEKQEMAGPAVPDYLVNDNASMAASHNIKAK